MHTIDKLAMSTVAKVLVILFCSIFAIVTSEGSPLLDVFRSNRQIRSASDEGSTDVASTGDRSLVSRLGGGTTSTIRQIIRMLLWPVSESYKDARGLVRFAEMENSNEIQNRGMISRMIYRLLWPFREIYNTIAGPFRVIGRIIRYVTEPIRFMYAVSSYPVKFLWHIYRGNENDLGTDHVNSTDISGSLGRIGFNFLENIGGNGTEQNSIELLTNAWDTLKTDVFPVIDHYIQQYGESDALSEETQSWMRRIHSFYKMLHLIGLA